MRLFRLLSLLLVALPGLSAAAGEAGGILWLFSDYPPNYILNGPRKGLGIAERREVLIRKALPEFQHHRMMANIARIQEEMKHRDNACNGSMQKTRERERFAIFSAPVLETLPNGLVTRSDRKADFAPFLNSRGELQLARLLQSGKFRLAVAAERSYGQYIDADLQAGRDYGSLHPFYAADIFTTGLLQLTRQKTVDAVLGYPTELGWALQQLKLAEEDFWFVPVEGGPPLMPTHVICSRSATGKVVIDRVNGLLRRGELQEDAERAYLEWLPAASRARYLQLRRPQKPGSR